MTGTGLTATANYVGATITFDYIDLAKVGSYQYKLVLTVVDQTYESNIATLTVTNPCLGTTIIDQAIDFSSLVAGYQQTINLDLPAFTDSVDQNPIYGTVGDSKCGALLISV